MAERWYFDTGIFVTPILRNLPPDIVAACLEWQRRARDGGIEAVTCTLTWDEVAWIAGKPRKDARYDPERAAEAGRLLLQLPGLRFEPVDRGIVEEAERIVASHRLRPRDGIHAAAALALADARIVTVDPDFDPLSGAEGIGLHVTRLAAAAGR